MPRVALTTTVHQASRLDGICGRAGLEPVMLPCIAIHRADDRLLDEARASAGSVDAIVVTSARAITTLWPGGGMPQVPVAAVGRATADAVEDAGGVVAFVGEGGAEELIDAMRGAVEGRTVLFPHAAGTAQSSVELLNGAGAIVRAMPVYRIEPLAPGQARVDAVTFASPSAVAGWSLSRDLDGLVVGAIGPTTAGAISKGHGTVDVVPPHPSFDDLIHLMAEHIRDRSAV